MNQIDLQGKHAIVTGGARGIGFAIARRLLASGASCSLWDIDKSALKAAVKILAPADKVHMVAVDVTDAGAVSRAAEATAKHFGSLEILVYNA